MYHLGDSDGSIFFDELKKYTKVHQIKADKLDELMILNFKITIR